MWSVKPSRIILVSSLFVLGISLAVFLSVTGAVSALTVDTTHEIAVQDNELVLGDDAGNQITLLEDVSEYDRVEVSSVNGQLTVQTFPYERPTVNSEHRERAKQIAANEQPIADRVDAADDTVFSIYPLVDEVSNEQAAVLGVEPESTFDNQVFTTEPSFSIHDDPGNNTIVLERDKQAISDNRVLVVIDPTENPLRYSMVINLETRTAETVIRFDPDRG